MWEYSCNVGVLPQCGWILTMYGYSHNVGVRPRHCACGADRRSRIVVNLRTNILPIIILLIFEYLCCCFFWPEAASLAEGRRNTARNTAIQKEASYCGSALCAKSKGKCICLCEFSAM